MSVALLFSQQAEAYRKFRPTYPAELFDFLAEQCRERGRVWDCGTGSGQAARSLAKRFAEVIATDVAPAQIKQAQPEPGVNFIVAPAEKSPLEDASADLVTVAQAIHWFDLEAFYTEVRRVLKPGGLIAVWGYSFFSTERPLHSLLDHYGRKTLAPYWNERLKLVDNGYRDLPFPFETIPAPKFSFSSDWDLAQLKGYLDSWSATQAYKTHYGGSDPFEIVRPQIEKTWKSPDRPCRFTWELALKIGRL